MLCAGSKRNLRDWRFSEGVGSGNSGQAITNFISILLKAPQQANLARGVYIVKRNSIKHAELFSRGLAFPRIDVSTPPAADAPFLEWPNRSARPPRSPFLFPVARRNCFLSRRMKRAFPDQAYGEPRISSRPRAMQVPRYYGSLERAAMPLAGPKRPSAIA